MKMMVTKMVSGDIKILPDAEQIVDDSHLEVGTWITHTHTHVWKGTKFLYNLNK